MSPIIGRNAQCVILKQLLDSGEPEFLAMYGRRRIGKTYLIQHFFKGKGIYFQQTGIHEGQLAMQLKQFAIEFSEVFNKTISTPTSWHQAFDELRKKISNIKEQKRIILFFDELPWLASKRSGFLPALEHVWNRYLSSDNRIIMIVCGSAAAWMIKKILHNKGGLHGRLTKKIRLLPFDLKETEQFLNAKNIHLDRKSLIELYMAMGGVAHYLRAIEKGLSAAQNINQILFSNEGILAGEFEKLFRSLYNSPEKHMAVVNLLAQKHYGLTQREILNALKLPSGGSASIVINELLESGFISKLLAFGKKSKESIYRLTDEYTYFYLSWIKNKFTPERVSEGENYWLKQRQQHSYKIWSGYAFENMCIKHSHNIKAALGIAGVTTHHSSWYHHGDDSAQIDLLIDRDDHCINLIEMRFYNKTWRITSNDIDALQRKKEIFQEVTQTNKTIFTTVITSFNASGHTQKVDQILTLDSLF